jgi:hypothetical protein
MGIALMIGAARARAAAPEPGVRLGARLGYGVPSGELTDDGDFDDLVDSKVVLGADLLYELDLGLALGAYVTYGFASVDDDACPPNTDCSAGVLRFGPQVMYSFYGDRSWLPWVGGGFGWERLAGGGDGDGGSVDLAYSGWEWLMLQGGVDWELDSGLRVGVFLQRTFGTYDHFDYELSSRLGTVSDSGDIDDTGTHSWTTLGVRVLSGW